MNEPERIVQISKANAYLLPFARAKLRMLWQQLRDLAAAGVQTTPPKRIYGGPKGETIEVSIVAGIGRIAIRGGEIDNVPFYWWVDAGSSSAELHVIIYRKNHTELARVTTAQTGLFADIDVLVSADASTVVITQLPSNTLTRTIQIFRVGNPDAVISETINLSDDRVPTAISADGTRMLCSGTGGEWHRYDITYDDPNQTASHSRLVISTAAGPYASLSIFCVDSALEFMYGHNSQTYVEGPDPETNLAASGHSRFDVYRVSLDTGAVSSIIALGRSDGLPPPPGGTGGSSAGNYVVRFFAPTAQGDLWIGIEEQKTGTANGTGSTSYEYILRAYKSAAAQTTITHTFGPSESESLVTEYGCVGSTSGHLGGGFGGEIITHNASDDGASLFFFELAYTGPKFGTLTTITTLAFNLRVLGTGATVVSHGAITNANDLVEYPGFNAHFADRGIVSSLKGRAVHARDGTYKAADDHPPTTVKAYASIPRKEANRTVLEQQLVGEYEITATWREYDFTIDALALDLDEVQPITVRIESETNPFLIDAITIDPGTVPFQNASFSEPAAAWAAEGVSDWGSSRNAIAVLGPDYLASIGASTDDSGHCGYGFAFTQTLRLPRSSYAVRVKLRRHPWWLPRPSGSENAAPMLGRRGRVLWHVPDTASGISGKRVRTFEYARVPADGFDRWELRQIAATKAAPRFSTAVPAPHVRTEFFDSAYYR